MIVHVDTCRIHISESGKSFIEIDGTRVNVSRFDRIEGKGTWTGEVINYYTSRVFYLRLSNDAEYAEIGVTEESIISVMYESPFEEGEALTGQP